jgi:tetratricopeptide (TPR) repeat protein
MNTDERIQNYINNQLSDEDRKLVEDLLNSDPDFKYEFDTHKDVSEAFKISEAKALKEELKALDRTDSSNKTNPKSARKYMYLAVACIFLLGFFFTVYNTTSAEQLFNSNFEIYPNTYQPVTRGTAANSNNSAFVAYENGDFKTAEEEFKALLQTTNDANIRFYYGLSLMNQAKFDGALAQFETIKNKEHDYTEEALWFQALIFLKKEDFSKTKDNLEQLNTLNSAFKSEERKLLLQKLSND